MVRPRFDPAREFVAMRGFTLHGAAVAKDVPIDRSKVDNRRLRMLYESRMVDFAPAGPPKPAEVVNMDGTPGGWYDITAPWLDEPVRVRGKVNARRKRDEMREAGEPLDHHGVALTEGENGWWEVKAEWAEEAEKVHGEEDARARAAELRAAGPPKELEPVDEIAAQVLVTVGESDWTVTAPWQDPETFDTAEAAEARQAEIREAGPPEGWEPPAPAGDVTQAEQENEA